MNEARPGGPGAEAGPSAGAAGAGPGLLRTALLALTAGCVLLLALDRLFPPPIPASAPASVVLAADGTPLRQWPGADGVWRQPVTPEEVSPLYLQALLGYEDRWFGQHPGVNPVALVRAAWQWARTGRVVSGGSTLTMQVARLIDPPPPGARRSAAAKARQILRALQLECRLDKREILTLYLNHAPMGGIVEGVEMASRAYLGKPARDLSPAEAALLAALPQAPSRLRPDRAPEAARAARDKLLARLAAQGDWPAARAEDARMEPVIVQPLRAAWIAPLAAERVRREAREAATLPADGRVREAGASRAGALAVAFPSAADATTAKTAVTAAVLQTTLDAELQQRIEGLLLDRAGTLPPKVSIAALVIDNDTLEVLAYAGSADFADAARAAHVDMVRGVRSPGSALKPFLYALALDEGLVHSESLLVDAPQSFGGYAPGNFQASFSGPVSVAEALQRSLNVPAVDLLDRLGPARFAQMLRAGGLRLRFEPGVAPNLSLILGGGGTTLEELVGAYRALARGGIAGRPRLTPGAPRREARLMSEGAAFIVRDILEGGGRPDRPFVEGGGGPGLAWKTGTSFGFRDAWAVGVTERHTLGVWVGRPDGTPNPGFFGANTAAPLLRDVVAATQGSRRGWGEGAVRRLEAVRPVSVQAVATCWPSGARAEATPAGQCAQRRVGWALEGTVPPTLPDRRSVFVANAACAAAALRWPVALEPWVQPASCTGAKGDGGAADPASAGSALAESSGQRLRINGIEPGAVLRPAPGQQHVDVTLSTLGRNGLGGGVFWLVDGQPQGHSELGRTWRLRLTTPGAHRITALDSEGRFDHVEVQVACAVAPMCMQRFSREPHTAP